MGFASYAIIATGKGWGILHDGDVEGEYATKEAAFESAVAAASLAIREGHEVHVSVPSRTTSGRAVPGANVKRWVRGIPSVISPPSPQ